MIEKAHLERLYLRDKKSMQEVADKLGCSLHKVSYWMDKHEIKRRDNSEATYVKRNPGGDPFTFRRPMNNSEHRLYGLGLGLYWGEGTKANAHSIRLGNTDPQLLNAFIDFLVTFFNIKRSDLRFGLQIFTDLEPGEALEYWRRALQVSKTQFHNPTVTKSGSIGTYRKKSQYGVVTIMYHNKKARDILNSLLPT